MGNDFYFMEFTPDKPFDRLQLATPSIILICFTATSIALALVLRSKSKNQDYIDAYLTDIY